MATNTNRYFSSWENYWGSLTGAPGEVFWEADPAQAARQDWLLFGRFCDSQLPLIDLGCGDGAQTRYLASHFASALGVDISPAALARARANNAAPNLSYRVLDILDSEAAQKLHDEIGDANVYLRGVLHQLAPGDRPAAARAIELLLGVGGALFLIELSPAAEPYFAGLIERYGRPPALGRVFQHGITPGQLSEHDVATLFPPDRFTTLSAGESFIRTAYRLPTGNYAQAPAFYRALRRLAG